MALLRLVYWDNRAPGGGVPRLAGSVVGVIGFGHART
jgi:hypothetical protein